MDFTSAENNNYSRALGFSSAGKLINIGAPAIMGIVNITPDSFFKDSRAAEPDEVVDKAGKMLREGADLLDLGAYSTRPGAAEITAEEELDRLIPAIEAVRKAFPEAVISADTFRSKVAIEAVKSGAGMVNDVSGGTLDPEMFETIGNLQCPYVLTHMRGTPGTMSQLTDYKSVFGDIAYWFSEKITELRQAGVKDILLDPGFGFAKTTEQNFELLSRLADFRVFGLPVMAGVSRKGMIWKTLGIQPEKALNGTTVLNTYALLHGASVIRVHDVKEAAETRRLLAQLTKNQHPPQTSR